MSCNGLLEGVEGFRLKTTYPGLLCGIGYHHEVNRPKEKGKEQGKKKDEPLLYQLETVARYFASFRLETLCISLIITIFNM
ncbi:hypothetical protein [Porphyromonas sp. COT-290 OH860]|uniref:hypothetical protein n=1 Tax=Porphyromonas sp. COT-290 OH860 TaxID=1515615 RepID=UPI00052BF407|nr:hypothetical protein [Porphyromonas sp. COT-290 OH860]KGN85305.1 hypothetical protein HQ41_03265 [Porphyromonas sp. COT-290 OH860]